MDLTQISTATDSNNYYYYETLGGIMYDFGWWYRITQIGVNSLFYPQYNSTVDSNKKYPIFNLSSIIESILNINRKIYSYDGIISPVGLCVVEMSKYSNLKYGPINNSFCGKQSCNVNDNNVCSKGNTVVYIKTSRNNKITGNPVNKSWNYTYLNNDASISDKLGLLETSYPPYYGGYEFVMGIENKAPSEYYDQNKKLIGKSSFKYYIIKENQFGVVPQIPVAVFSKDKNVYINSVFTAYVLNYEFFFNNLPDNAPWWTFTDYYKIIKVDLSDFTCSKSSVGIDPSVSGFIDFDVRNLNNYYRIRYRGLNNKNNVYYSDSFDLTRELKLPKYDSIFLNSSGTYVPDAIILYPSSLILIRAFSRQIVANGEFVTDGYTVDDSPTIIQRFPPDIDNASPNYYFKLRSNVGINNNNVNVNKTPNTISSAPWSSDLGSYLLNSQGTGISNIKFNLN